MLKSIINLGKVLNKTEQRTVSGGIIKCPDGTRYVCIGLPPMRSCWCHAFIAPGEDVR